MLPMLPTPLALCGTRRRPSRKVAWAASAVLALLSAPSQAANNPPKGYGATLPVITPPRSPDGSIFNVNAGYAPLIEGNRARAVGDIVNIVLAEATTTNKTAVTKTQRAASATLPAPTIGPRRAAPVDFANIRAGRHCARPAWNPSAALSFRLTPRVRARPPRP